MTDEQLAKLRAIAASFSGLQYAVAGSPLGWPWTSAPTINRLVDLVRAVPALLETIDALAAADAPDFEEPLGRPTTEEALAASFRERISHAEFSRFVEEAVSQRARADALTAEVARLTAELAAERERNAPLRARIKALAEQHDADTATLQKQVARARFVAEHAEKTTTMNYEKLRAAEAERDALREALAMMTLDRDRLWGAVKNAFDDLETADLADLAHARRLLLGNLQRALAAAGPAAPTTGGGV